MTDKLATTTPGTLARPDFLKEGIRGKENIDLSRIRPPSFRLAQAMTPQTKRSEPEYIEGLREGDAFNSLTGEILGEGPFHVLVVNPLGRRNVLFDPKDRKLVLEDGLADDDPRCQFTETVVDGKTVRTKPQATTFESFLILLLREGGNQLFTWTVKATQLKKANRLNGLLASSKLDSFAHLFRFTPTPERKGDNSWYGWRIDPAGYPLEKDYREAESFYEKFKKAGTRIEVGVADEDAADGAEATDKVADDVPF